MIKGLKIRDNSTYFSEETNIDLFWDEATPVNGRKYYSIVYGKNGSGKTTISDIFYNYKNKSKEYELLNFYDDSDTLVELPKESIFVFNEQFIDDFVKVSEDNDSLNAIVLLGKTVDIDTEIEKNKKIILSEEKKISDRNIQAYHEAKNSKCIEDSYNNIILQLKNTWAIREQKIRNLGNRAQVKEDIIKEMLSLTKPKNGVKELSNKLDELIAKINRATNNQNKIEPLMLSCPLKSTEFYNSLLNTTFDKKTMSEFSIKVLNSIQSHNSIYLSQTKDVIKNDDLCPLCFQNIKKEHKETIIQILDSLFDKTIEAEIEKLKREKVEIIDCSTINAYIPFIDKEILDPFLNSIYDVNEIVSIINGAIDKKIGSIYEKGQTINAEIDKTLENYKYNLNAVNKAINNFNENIDNKNKNIEAAKILNKQISFYDLESLVNNYHLLLNEEKELSDANRESYEIIKKANEDIKKLNSQKSNFSIALDEINTSLKFIFGTSRKIQLKPTESGDKYYIYSKGRKIKYSKLSTGERNIIGLVYFYETLKEGCTESNYFSNQCLYIIDDPISSFDYDNKIGILSFLKKIFSEIISGNINSKIAVLTHELEVAGYISRTFDDLNLGNKKCSRELLNKTTKRMNPTKYTSYGSLLNEVFEFCDNEDKREELFIANTIRRLVEAYSYFNYNVKMDIFLTDPQYYSKINDNNCREYFKCRMSRLLMNEGSHAENVIRQVPDTLNFDLFGSDDVLQTAKDIICFLYLLDKVHIQQYLGSQNINKIQTWVNEIKNIYTTDH